MTSYFITVYGVTEYRKEGTYFENIIKTVGELKKIVKEKDPQSLGTWVSFDFSVKRDRNHQNNQKRQNEQNHQNKQVDQNNQNKQGGKNNQNHQNYQNHQKKQGGQNNQNNQNSQNKPRD